MRFPLAAVIVAVALAAGLSACAPDDHQLIQPTPALDGEGTFDPDSDPVNGSVGINCQALVTDQVIYEWGSGNFALDIDYVPTAGSTAAQIVTEGGLACSWVNLTSSETVDVAVAAPASEVLSEAAASAAAAGQPAPLISDDAYFSAANGVGHVEAFTTAYWITADSTWFLSEQDAAPLLTAALTALG